jgi:MFS family permease
VRSVASLAPLGRRPFRLLWIGQSVSAAGDAVAQIAQVFAVLRVGGDATDIGLVIGTQLLTRLVFVLVGGVWADRLRRQFVMLSSDLLRVAVQAALAVTLMTGLARVWQLAACAGVYGAAQAFFLPASAGLVPEVVPAEQLQQANALMSFARNLFSIGGPAVAGLLIAAFGPGPVFAVDAATFAVSAVSLAMLRLPPRNLPARGSFRGRLA